MAIVRRAFDKYKIQYTSTKQPGIRACITCNDGNQEVARILFVKDESLLYDPYLHPGGSILVPMVIDRFKDVIDILRHENPLEIYLNTGTRSASILSIELEPVGEAE